MEPVIGWGARRRAPAAACASWALAPLIVVAMACAPGARAPEATAAPDLGKRAVGSRGAVTSAHPQASEAGLAMLRAGGNAIDAAVAAAFAIGVTEPQMSGVGGGGALLFWDQRRRAAEYLDFYPAQPVERWRGARADSTVPLRIAAIPGNVAGLLAAHERYGRLTRAQVLAPAIALAERGFPVYPVLAELLARDTTRLKRDSIARRLYWPSGRLLGMGDTLRNADLAAVLMRVATNGRDGFYRGPTAQALVTRLRAGGHPATLDDVAAYQPQWKRPLCTTYRGRTVLSAPPPMGGVQLLHTLELLEGKALSSLGLPTRSAAAFDLMTSAMSVGILAHAGNDDPRWKAIPARGLVSGGFAATWRDVVGVARAADSVQARDARPFEGEVTAECRSLRPFPEAAPVAPDGNAGADFAVRDSASGGETTHISVVDGDGNAVAVTVTNSSMFGSGVAVAGFWLNDSGWWPRDANAIPATLPAQWRTRITTIAPTVFVRDGAVEVVVGSPGGGRIPFALAQSIAYVVDYGLDPLEALRMPRIYPTRTRRVEVEGGFDAEVLAQARAMGYLPVLPGFGYARVYLIARRGKGWVAAADPRHDGEARAW